MRQRPCAVDAEALLATIVESSDDAIVGKSLDGVIFSWNSGAERLFGYHRDDVIGRPVSILVQQDRMAEWHRLMGWLRQGRRVAPFDTVRLRKDGSPVDVSLTVSPIFNSEGELVGASSIARDITDRKRAYEAQREALGRLRAVFEAAVDGIVTIDEGGVIETANTAAQKMFGYSADELIGQNVGMLMPKPHRRRHNTYLSNYVRSGDARIIGIDQEVRGRRRDGSTFPMELAVSESRLRNRRLFTGIVRDVTRRREAEKALQESENRFRAIVECQAEMVCRFRLDGTLLFVNGAYARFRGTTSEQLVGTSFWHLIDEEDRPRVREMLEGLRPDAPEVRIENRFEGDHGVRWTLWTNRALAFDAAGRGTEFQSTGIDITERRQAELALRLSEKRYRSLTEAMTSIVWTTDAQGRCVTPQPSWTAYTGQAWEELRDFGWSHAIHPEDRDRLMALWFEACETKSVYRSEGRLWNAASQSYRHYEGRGIPILDDDGSVHEWVGTCVDVEDRKSAESALRASENRFRLMADSAPTMIWMCDAQKSCNWFNKRWLAFTGRTMEEALNGWTRGVHAEDLERFRRAFHSAFDEGQPFEIEFRLRRSDGEYRWIHNVGVPMTLEGGEFAGYIGSCIDVTDRKLDEASLIDRVAQRTRELTSANEQLQLQISERRRIESLLAAEKRILELMARGESQGMLLNAICSTIEDLIVESRCAIRLTPSVSRPADPTASDANSASTLGMHVYGSIAAEGVYPPIRSERTLGTREDIVGDDRLGDFVFRSFWFEPIVAPGGAVVGTLGIYSPNAEMPTRAALSVGAMTSRLAGIIVERTRAEALAREQFAQLAHVARLATMGEMASELAHELNQPLCAIVNFTEACTELMTANRLDRDRLKQALCETTRQAERAGEVIRRLRGFVKRQEPERKPTDVNEIVNEVVALTEVEARHSEVRVGVNLAPRLPRIFADALQIEQVLVNLVRNGFEAMREGNLAQRALTLKTLRRRGAVEIQVGDNGPGIPEDVMGRIFEPFYTTKPEGLGMGLSISRSILEVHEGSLWVTSNDSGGTTFHLRIPTAWSKRHAGRHRIHRG